MKCNFIACPSQKTINLTFTKISRLELYKEAVRVFCENRVKHAIALWVKQM